MSLTAAIIGGSAISAAGGVGAAAIGRGGGGGAPSPGITGSGKLMALNMLLAVPQIIDNMRASAEAERLRREWERRANAEKVGRSWFTNKEMFAGARTGLEEFESRYGEAQARKAASYASMLGDTKPSYAGRLT